MPIESHACFRGPPALVIGSALLASASHRRGELALRRRTGAHRRPRPRRPRLAGPMHLLAADRFDDCGCAGTAALGYLLASQGVQPDWAVKVRRLALQDTPDNGDLRLWLAMKLQESAHLAASERQF